MWMFATWLALTVALGCQQHVRPDGPDLLPSVLLQPSNAEALSAVLRGETALRLNDVPAAVVAFKEAVLLDRRSGHVALRLAHALRLAGSVDEALEACSEASVRGAPRWQVQLERAEILITAGRWPEAASVLSAPVADAPDSYYDTWHTRALAAPDAQAQLAAAERWSTAHDRNPAAWEALGMARLATGALASAVQAFDRAADLPSGSARAAELSASTLLQLNRHDEALQRLALCTRRYREHIPCYTLRVQVAARADDDPALDDAVDGLARMTTANLRVFQNTIAQLERQTSPGTVVRYLRRAVALRPLNLRIAETAAWTANRLGDTDAAILIFEHVISVDQDHVEALNFVGYTWADRNTNLRDAERYIRRALELSPEAPGIMDSLAWVLHRRGRHRAALDVQLDAVSRAPTNAVLLDHLGDIHHALRQYSEAFEAWSRALLHATERDEDVLQRVPPKLEALERSGFIRESTVTR